ncbi:hypothetical protein JTE90_009959 [Oedothorax gibbosus]|uniref:Ionotropic glutamate receptor L-glutamate and glycine-binding domain-containing protein n=1 Tax=Oedothorax gibbosus TaxID=931172 RepID=A0AAV6V998_9ARAC|nr:hypothetical protein JTE90_009959 [Oedothorax gibbosus]
MQTPTLLNVAVLSLPPLFKVNFSKEGDHMHSGFEGRFLDVLFGLLRWKYNLLVAEDKEWGRQTKSGNWTGLIGMILRNEADMALSRIAISEQRLKIVDFSMAYSTEDSTFVVEKPKDEHLSFAYLYPFDFTIWIGFLLVLLLLAVLFPLFLKRRHSFWEVFFDLYTTVMKQPSNITKYDSHAGRYLFTLWLCFAMVLSITYSAKLFNLMAMPHPATPIRTFRELSQAVKNGEHKCFTAKGTNTVQSLLESKEEYLQNLGEAIESNEWYARASELESGTYINENSAQQLSRTRSHLFFGSNWFESRYLISDDSLGFYPIGIALSKKFCCKLKLNRALYRLASTGIYEKFIKDESLKLELSRSKHLTQQIVQKQVVLKDMLGLLILYAIGILLSLCALSIEMIDFKIKLKRKSRRWKIVRSKTFFSKLKHTS